ncbi:IclR family transcriptional regulator domain-containing protein [uncultured Sulfitobacter sp.]|uniref:IclR family transcriptional regulator domain-containing protein n=1 Tax=Sulfitobacter sp. SH22 TaxID=3421172 RepID=UPI0025EDC826|nr:IclR family transcriptional regulator C-terminal domain-containing protein [uncultured Sulfitobacter sp.]
MEKADRIPEFVEGLAKGLAVIACFDDEHSELTLSEVARRTDTSASSARRSLLTLVELGYVGVSARRFFLKPKILRLVSSSYFSNPTERFLQPELQHVVDTFGDASSFAILDGTEVLYLSHVSVQKARRAKASVGARYPAHATSLGRAILSALPDDALDAWLDSMEPLELTAHTLTDKTKIRDRIIEARELGYATTVDELDYGVTAIAVPVHCRGLVAAVNSSGYTGSNTPQQMISDRFELLRDKASLIAQVLDNHPQLTAMLQQ